MSVLDPLTFHVKIAEANQKDSLENNNNNAVNPSEDFTIDLDSLDFHRGGYVTKKKQSPQKPKPAPLTPKKESETKHLPTKSNARKVAKELQSMLPKGEMILRLD